MKLIIIIVAASALSLCSFNSQYDTGNRPNQSNNAVVAGAENNLASRTASTENEATVEEGQTNRDREQVARELVELKRRWIEAIRTVDLQTMDAILADEFVNIRSNGERDPKARFMDSRMVPDPNPLTVSIEQPRLTDYNGNRATMSYIVSITNRTTNVRSRDTDTFIRRGGRWQILSSVSSPTERR